MTRQEKITQLLSRLDALKQERLSISGGGNLGVEVQKLLNEEAESAKVSTKDSPTSKALLRIAGEVGKVKKDPQIDKIIGVIKKTDAQNKQKFQSLSDNFEGGIQTVLSRLAESSQQGETFTTREVSKATEQIKTLLADFNTNKQELESKDALLAAEIDGLRQDLATFNDTVVNDRTASQGDIVGVKKSAADISDALKEIDTRLTSRLASIQNHGGNANRNIAIGGNTSVLSTYTDINLKAGVGTTLTYSNNPTTKYLDLTITATGGGSGITRSISSVAVDTVAAAIASTDYVYLISGTTKLTLPTAVGNTNLYTVKNVGTGVVTIDTTGGQTIDGDSTVVMPIQYTSVDIISDGSNWKVT